MEIKWIIFDVMGVIFTVGDDTNDLLVPFIQKKNSLISKETINEFYLEASLGKISAYAFWNELGFGKDYLEIEKEYLDNYLTIDCEFREVILKLKKEFNLAILSNDLKEWSKYLRKKYDMDKLFKEVIISGEVKYRKPDENIFKVLLEKIGTTSDKCIFIDDRIKNLREAENMGFKTILFNRDKSDTTIYKSSIGSFKELYERLKKFHN